MAQAPIPLQTGDVFALCTDGLWNLLTDEELHLTVRDQDPEGACRDLVELAKW